jgi:hypothetical protein
VERTKPAKSQKRRLSLCLSRADETGTAVEDKVLEVRMEAEKQR